MRILLLLVATVLTLLVTRIIQWLFQLWMIRKNVTKTMAAQGIFGPTPTSFIGGNSKDIRELNRQAQEKVMETLNHDIVSRIHPFEHKYSQVYGKCYLSWTAWDPSLKVAEPQQIHDVLTSRSFTKTGIQRKFMEPLFGKGIIMAVGDDWAHQRNMINPVFHAESIKEMVKTMELCVSYMVKTWEQFIESSQQESVEIDVNVMLTRLTAEIIAHTAFGSTYQGTERYIKLEDELQKEVLSQPFFCLIPGYRLLPTKINKRLHRLNTEVKGCVQEIIHKREVESKGDPGLFGKDILGLLLAATHADHKNKRLKVSRELLVDQCKSFFFAGHETSAQTLTWAMMLLAVNPEWQNKARQEVREVHESNIDHTFDAEMLSKLKTVGMVISETLRLYPAATVLSRGACEDTYIGGKGTKKLFIPKGVHVSFSILSLHHDKSIWGEDASEFRPGRFKATIPAGAYLPFGAGSRVCIGRSFALTEMKLVLSMLLSKFKWELSPAYRHSPMSKVTLCPQHGMQLLVSHV